MKKVIILFTMVLIVVGCNISNTPSSKVQKYLDSFINLSEDVEMDIETTVTSENLSNENKEIYKSVLKRQYQDLKYEIKDEKIDGDNAQVTVKVTIYDLYHAEKESLNYMNEHTNEFNDENGMFNNELYNTFRINKLLEENNKVDYEIVFNLDKKDTEWILRNPDRDTLEKINGLYKYD